MKKLFFILFILASLVSFKVLAHPVSFTAYVGYPGLYRYTSLGYGVWPSINRTSTLWRYSSMPSVARASLDLMYQAAELGEMQRADWISGLTAPPLLPPPAPVPPEVLDAPEINLQKPE